jgi:hypothetical protein
LEEHLSHKEVAIVSSLDVVCGSLNDESLVVVSFGGHLEVIDSVLEGGSGHVVLGDCRLVDEYVLLYVIDVRDERVVWFLLVDVKG